MNLKKLMITCLTLLSCATSFCENQTESTPSKSRKNTIFSSVQKNPISNAKSTPPPIDISQPKINFDAQPLVSMPTSLPKISQAKPLEPKPLEPKSFEISQDLPKLTAASHSVLP